MKRIVAIGLGSLAAVGCVESATDPGSDRREGAAAMVEVDDADRLADSWRWSRRVVIAVGPESALARQAALVGDHWEEWCDRDLQLVVLTRGGGLVVERFVDGGPVGATFDETVEAGLEKRFGLDPHVEGFQAVLIGKDGGVKFRWNEVVAPAAVFDLVDAMPMRMREMREDDR